MVSGKGNIATLVFSCCELLVQIHAGNSKFLASTSMPSLNSSTTNEVASSTAPVALPMQSAANATSSSNAENVCKAWCLDENSPEAADAQSMCERESCKGCPQCETLETTTPAPSLNPLSNRQADGKMPGDGQDKSAEGNAGECTGGPDCIGKDFGSCAQIQHGSLCTWWTSATTKMPAVDISSSKEGKVCKPWCRDENSPEVSDVRSMCELDSCKGCPLCETLPIPTLTPNVSSISIFQAEGKMPGDGPLRSSAGECTGGPDCSGKDFGSCEQMQAHGMCKWATKTASADISTQSQLASSTEPAAPPEAQSSIAAVRSSVFASLLIGSMIA